MGRGPCNESNPTLKCLWRNKWNTDSSRDPVSPWAPAAVRIVLPLRLARGRKNSFRSKHKAGWVARCLGPEAYINLLMWNPFAFSHLRMNKSSLHRPRFHGSLIPLVQWFSTLLWCPKESPPTGENHCSSPSSLCVSWDSKVMRETDTRKSWSQRDWALWWRHRSTPRSSVYYTQLTREAGLVHTANKEVGLTGGVSV